MIFQGRDGQLRIIEKGDWGQGTFRTGSTWYLEVLFCGMDFSAPLERPKTEERIILNRNVFDSDAHYVQGSDDAKMAPLSLSFSCMVDDKKYSGMLHSVLSGATEIPMTAGVTKWASWDGSTTIGGISLPTFADSTKQSYRVEVLWDGSTDYGMRYEEVYFPPDQQTITESEDGLSISVTALAYGDVSRISAFTAGTTKAT